MTDSPGADPRHSQPDDGFAPQEQEQPGTTDQTRPTPDHGEESYRGSDRLRGRRALITGGDSGIGRAVAIAFAREGADVAIVHMPEEREDADETVGWIEKAGCRGRSFAGDIRDEGFATGIVDRTVAELGGLDVVVLNAAYQKDRESLGDLTTEEFDRVFRTNLYGMLWTARAAVPHLEPGSSIIVTASIQAFDPSPHLIDYAMTKAAQVAFVKALAEQLGEKGIRVNAVAPGPIWTPLIPATGGDPEWIEEFGQDTPLGRAGQPAELAGAYVYLASDAATYTSGAVLPVTGGKGL
ncbi:SDR family oxidoreductase [Microbacterium sp.]|uniref:SDR family oxidoreductase n=1 Tax=Microbacterium sp. TaxID=51671 RepID=UPI002D79D8F7|nr:SDR family oxidoreductase [Microbacterium sp.]HET6302306.1 SDR family oxidoreductase [Microbacterium sp.]